MKICQNCGATLEDSMAFCTNCGAQMPMNQQPSYEQYQQPPYQPQYQNVPVYNPYDHTAEFDPQDVSNNKVIAMLVYLAGAIGIIIALLVGNDSKYVAFHVRQALKFTVIEILTSLISALLCWTFIVPIAAFVFYIVLFVVKIICFFQICSGKAKEPAIIRGFSFLK